MDSSGNNQKDEKSRGLYNKYNVSRVDGKPLNGNLAIVLEIGDPNTWDAISEYCRTVRRRGYKKLADDISLIMEEVVNGE